MALVAIRLLANIALVCGFGEDDHMVATGKEKRTFLLITSVRMGAFNSTVHGGCYRPAVLVLGASPTSTPTPSHHMSRAPRGLVHQKMGVKGSRASVQRSASDFRFDLFPCAAPRCYFD